MTKFLSSFLCGITLLAVSACSNQPIGFSKSGPNEFLITTYPALTVPPNWSLKAPTNATTTQKAKTDDVVNQLLFGMPVKYARGLSAPEKALLNTLGTQKAKPNIRKLIAEDRGLAIIDTP